MMKRFSMKLTTLKSKLYAIVFASFVVRVVAFFALPNKESSLAPDEGNYGALTEWIAQSKPADEYEYSSLYLDSRSLIIPATLLYRLGFSGLDSVRIISSMYGLFTVLLASFMILKLLDSSQEVSNFISKNQKKVLFLFSIFAFLPSHLIWTLLGLRESAMEFWILLVLILVFYIFHLGKGRTKSASIGILLTIPLVFSSRPQAGWALGITLLIYFFIRIRVKPAQILIPITLIGIIVGYTVTTQISIDRDETFVAQVDPKELNPSLETAAVDQANLLCEFSGQVVSIGKIDYVCNSAGEKRSIVGLKNPGVALVDQADAIPVRHEGNKVGAASAIKTLSCPIKGESRFDKYFCIVYRAPYTTFTFLFRPMLGADVTSTPSLYAAVENISWLAAFFFVAILLVRNRKLAFFETLAPSLLFFSIYTVGAGASEGNMGTAFRHKSLILWVVILLLASTIVATQQRKSEREGISDRS
jgi:hypothetical protein